MKKILLVISLFIVSCGDLSHEVSILDKSTCKFPCWNDVVMGETTEGEFLRIIENLPEINQQSIKNNNQPRPIFENQILFSFEGGKTFWQSTKIRGYADTKENIVKTLMFCGKLNTTLSKLVELLGEPEYIISGNAISGGRTVILIDSKNGVSYWFTADLSNLEIASPTQIDCILIFDLSSYETMLDAGFFSNGYYNAEETRRVWYSWNGYGNLDEKYPPRQP